MAARAELSRERALREQAREGVFVGDRLHRLTRGVVVGATLEREDALSGRRDEALRIEHAADLGVSPQSLQPGAREHDRVELFLGVRQLAQARVDVAADAHHVQILARGPQLGEAADAAGAHARARAQLLEGRRPAEDVLAGRPRRGAVQRQAAGELAGDVLGRVHRQVDLPREQGALELAHPAGLVARVGVARDRPLACMGTISAVPEQARDELAPAPARARWPAFPDAAGRAPGGTPPFGVSAGGG